MASWPRVSRPVGWRVPLRFIHLGQQGVSSAGSFVHRRGVTARLHFFRRNNTIDSAAHDLVAFACRGFEPRSVNLDRAPPIGSDSPRQAELAHDMRHRRSSYAKQLRKRLLRQRQSVTVNAVVDMEQPPRRAGLHRVQRIAGGHVLALRQQRPGEDLDRMSDGATAVEGRMKSCWRNLQCGPGHAYDRRHRSEGGSQRCQEAHGSLISDDRGCNRFSARHVHDERDRPALREINLFNWISRSYQRCAAFKRYFPEVRSEQTKICWRQRSQESITNPGRLLHHGKAPSLDGRERSLAYYLRLPKE